jgi:hypothetical protein
VRNRRGWCDGGDGRLRAAEDDSRGRGKRDGRGAYNAGGHQIEESREVDVLALQTVNHRKHLIPTANNDQSPHTVGGPSSYGGVFLVVSKRLHRGFQLLHINFARSCKSAWSYRGAAVTHNSGSVTPSVSKRSKASFSSAISSRLRPGRSYA